MSEKLLPPYKKQASPHGDRAYVVLNNKRVYLGEYNSPESRECYRRTIAEWQTRGCRPAIPPDALTITQLCARFLAHAETYYVKPDGTQTSEVSTFKQLLKLLVQQYGDYRAVSFGPLAMKSLRECMIEKGWVRSSINKQLGRLKVMFRWAVAEELLPPSVHHALCAVAGLKRGRCKARESEPVLPVSDTDIERVKPFVSRQVWAMIQLQLLTGARSGEIAILRPCDLTKEGIYSTYRPSTHKTEHHGRDRVIYLGPRALGELEPLLVGKGPTDFVFSAADGERELRVRKHAARKTPLSCGNKPMGELNEDRVRAPGAHYDQSSYRRSITRACKKAGIEPWHPHQLRHSAATLIRRQFGLEAAQIILGHSRMDVTQLYAERDSKIAINVASAIG